MLAASVFGLVPGLALALARWGLSLPLRDASLADRIWPLLVVLPGFLDAWRLTPDGAAGASAGCWCW